MKIHITEIKPNAIRVAIRAEGPGGLVGDSFQTVRQGEGIAGLRFDELKALGVGEHEIKGTF